MKKIKIIIGIILLIGMISSCGYFKNKGEQGCDIKDLPNTIIDTQTPEPPSQTQTPQPSETPTNRPLTTQKPQIMLDDIAYSSMDNKGCGWGFKRLKGCEPEIFDSTKELFKKYDTYYMDQTKPKAMYLTFDEGYENGYTGQILDTLKKNNVPAAFFITGPYLKTEQLLVDRMVNEGHIVGNHTVKHPNMPKLASVSKVEEELSTLNMQFKDLYGIDMKYMRPPEGEYSERVLAVAKDLGYKTIFWSFAYKDWDTKLQRGEEYAYQQVTPYFHDGAIILLHAVSKDNADALERIIKTAKSQGYEFRSLDQLGQENTPES